MLYGTFEAAIGDLHRAWDGEQSVQDEETKAFWCTTAQEVLCIATATHAEIKKRLDLARELRS